MPASREEADAFARAWIEAWNRKDVEQVLSHFAPDARFTSPKAVTFAGVPTLTGVPALREYWGTAAQRVQHIRFTLDYTLWDELRRELVVVYTADLDGRRNRACEFMRFDADGRQVAGEAMYGIEV
jgi:steroid delta-isomerase